MTTRLIVDHRLPSRRHLRDKVRHRARRGDIRAHRGQDRCLHGYALRRHQRRPCRRMAAQFWSHIATHVRRNVCHGHHLVPARGTTDARRRCDVRTASGPLYSLTGATAGATLAFLLSRYVASDWVAARLHTKLPTLMQGIESEGWKFVGLVRLVPILPFNGLNYALGLTRIKLSHYVWASFAFMLPGALAYCYLGHLGREAAAGAAGNERSSWYAFPRSVRHRRFRSCVMWDSKNSSFPVAG
jgi:hypothetical protein